MESIGSLDISRFDEKVRLLLLILDSLYCLHADHRPVRSHQVHHSPGNLYVRLILMDGKSQESFQGISSSLMQMSILDVKMRKI